MQVADVNRALMSVSRAVDAETRIVFDDQWCFIGDKRMGERTTIARQGGLYVLEAWIKSRGDPPASGGVKGQRDGGTASSPFARQGGKR